MPNIKTVPNQNVVKVIKNPVAKKIFAQIEMEALNAAAQKLDAGAFKLWIYFAKNQTNYEFALSQKAVEDTFGMKKKQYDRAFDVLVEKGYLIQTSKNHYEFRETAEKDESKTQYQKDTTELNQNISQYQKDTTPQYQKDTTAQYQKDTRNITDITINNTSNITDAFDLTSKSNGGDVPEEEEIGTLDNPILVSMEWLAERHNLIHELTNKRWKYGDKIYTMKQ